MNSELGNKVKFFNPNEQCGVIEFLKSKNPTLYYNLDKERRTFFIRETGDNFRASARFPTEQFSISVINIEELLNSPYGQFVMSLWRGTECRENVQQHLTMHFGELEEVVKSGLDLFINGVMENFNVVVFLCTDLGFCFVHLFIVGL